MFQILRAFKHGPSCRACSSAQDEAESNYLGVRYPRPSPSAPALNCVSDSSHLSTAAGFWEPPHEFRSPIWNKVHLYTVISFFGSNELLSHVHMVGFPSSKTLLVVLYCLWIVKRHQFHIKTRPIPHFYFVLREIILPVGLAIKHFSHITQRLEEWSEH